MIAVAMNERASFSLRGCGVKAAQAESNAWLISLASSGSRSPELKREGIQSPFATYSRLGPSEAQGHVEAGGSDKPLAGNVGETSLPHGTVVDIPQFN
jgi:hypothetical protein